MVLLVKHSNQKWALQIVYIGNILVENVIFQVLNDEVLNFPTADFQMEGILGFPVITALKQVQIRKDGHFIVSASILNKETSNMAFDASTTIISAVTNGDTLSYHFDTGATGTELYSNYFNKYQAAIKKDGVLQEVESGGAGGIVKKSVYILPHFDLIIGNKKVSLKEVAVNTIPPFEGQKYNGNIGQDLINQFDEIVLNFEYMYVEFQE